MKEETRWLNDTKSRVEVTGEEVLQRGLGSDLVHGESRGRKDGARPVSDRSLLRKRGWPDNLGSSCRFLRDPVVTGIQCLHETLTKGGFSSPGVEGSTKVTK